MTNAAFWLGAISTLCLGALTYHPAIHTLTRTYDRDLPLELIQFDGKYFNRYLQHNTRHLGRGKTLGQETVVLHSSGSIYVFDALGWLLHVNESDDSVTRHTYIGGRVLGAKFATKSKIYACDASRGLISIDIEQNVTVVETAMAGNLPILYCDDVDVAADGTVYFTDAMQTAPVRLGSGVWTTMELSMVDFFRGCGSGRLLKFDPHTRVTTVLLDGLYFANGVAISGDQSFVVVAETFNMRLQRFWITGPRQGTADILASLHTPIDGISATEDGSGFWIACPTLPDWKFVFVGNRAWLRWIIGNLARWVWPKQEKYGMVMRTDKEGALQYILHDPTGTSVDFVTAVEERDGKLYLGQLHGNSIPVVAVPSPEEAARLVAQVVSQERGAEL